MAWLIKNGVPYDVAVSMDRLQRAAFAIHFSRFEGSRFNIERLEWEKRDA